MEALTHCIPSHKLVKQEYQQDLSDFDEGIGLSPIQEFYNEKLEDPAFAHFWEDPLSELRNFSSALEDVFDPRPLPKIERGF
jgi:hypothetical protein